MIQKISKHWRNNQMKYWLMKSEPNVWSIDQQQKAGSSGTDWDGVRNYQAKNNLKMKKGDLCFFYHSNIGKEIVGIIEVIKTAFTDPTDKTNRFVATNLFVLSVGSVKAVFITSIIPTISFPMFE